MRHDSVGDGSEVQEGETEPEVNTIVSNVMGCSISQNNFRTLCMPCIQQ